MYWLTRPVACDAGWMLCFVSLCLGLSRLLRWTQNLRCRSSLVQPGRAKTLVAERCHQPGQEEDLNRSRAWNAEGLSSSSFVAERCFITKCKRDFDLTRSSLPSLRCNRTSPCSSCLKRGLADRCTGASRSNTDVGSDATGLLL